MSISNINNKEGLYEQMFQSATIGILLVNEQGTILGANSYVTTLFGYNKEELVGLSVDRLLPKALRAAHAVHRRSYQQKPTARAMGKGMNLQALRKDGSSFLAEISLGHTLVNGKLHVIAYINDISERQKMEASLKDYQTRLLNYTEALELKVMQRTQDLEKALKQEKQLGALKSRFVSMASHEFRTPLSSILSSTELLAHYLQNGSQEKGQKNINRIKNALHHLTTLLNDFLNLEKLEARAIKYQPTPTSIREWLTEIIEEIQPLLKDGQQIEVVQNTPTIIAIDDYLLKNIVLNLLSNASKYSPPTAPIYLELTLIDATLTLVIQDKGMGIPEAEQANLFTRFFRASNVEHIQGTGLSLTIVKRYVELMDGTIEFQSREGQGSCFVVRLPLPD